MPQIKRKKLNNIGLFRKVISEIKIRIKLVLLETVKVESLVKISRDLRYLQPFLRNLKICIFLSEHVLRNRPKECSYAVKLD